MEKPEPEEDGEFMFSKLEDRFARYAEVKGLSLDECLGLGVDGSVWRMTDNANLGVRAVKIHRHKQPYIRERDCYQRLREEGILSIEGFGLPVLLGWDDEAQAIEMTIVSPPCLVDFASATLDAPMDFSPEIWAEWEEDRAEKFGERWPQAKQVLLALERLGIYLGDVHPGNMMFVD